jgi:hypothetical protein
MVNQVQLDQEILPQYSPSQGNNGGKVIQAIHSGGGGGGAGAVGTNAGPYRNGGAGLEYWINTAVAPG